MKFSTGRGKGICFVFIMVGAVLGGLFGEALLGVGAISDVMRQLTGTYPLFVLPPTQLNLFVVCLTVGFSFTPNIMSLLGVVVALVLYRRY